MAIISFTTRISCLFIHFIAKGFRTISMEGKMILVPKSTGRMVSYFFAVTIIIATTLSIWPHIKKEVKKVKTENVSQSFQFQELETNFFGTAKR